MPSEKISDQTQQRWHTEVSWRRKPCTHEPGEDGPVCDDVAERGSAPGHVQIATVNLDSPFEFPEREADGAWEAGERFDGWRVTLDEAGCDRLIKALHKAKRQAFPPDIDGDALAEAERYYRDVLDSVTDMRAAISRDPDGDGERVQVQPGTPVTVESDATAAARLDVDRYRAVRRGDR